MKLKFMMIGKLIILVMIAQSAHAGLINPDRKAKRQSIKTGTAAPVTSQASTYNVPIEQQQIQQTVSPQAEEMVQTPSAEETWKLQESTQFDQITELMKSQPSVTNRVEGVYDLNGDQKLQEEEILDLFSDVVSAVERRGDFDVSSTLLKDFDKNSDGKISRYEVWDIKRRIE